MSGADFHRGELYAFRVLLEDLVFWKVLTDDDMEVIRAIIRKAGYKLDEKEGKE